MVLRFKSHQIVEREQSTIIYFFYFVLDQTEYIVTLKQNYLSCKPDEYNTNTKLFDLIFQYIFVKSVTNISHIFWYIIIRLLLLKKCAWPYS